MDQQREGGRRQQQGGRATIQPPQQSGAQEPEREQPNLLPPEHRCAGIPKRQKGRLVLHVGSIREPFEKVRPGEPRQIARLFKEHLLIDTGRRLPKGDPQPAERQQGGQSPTLEEPTPLPSQEGNGRQDACAPR
jgi:hypothetical protein